MNSEKICVAGITQATKAKRILEARGVSSVIVRSDCAMSSIGCSFEIRVSPDSRGRAAAILRKSGINLI